MNNTQAKRRKESPKQKKARQDAMYLDIIDQIKDELSPGCSTADMLLPLHRLLVSSLGSSGFESAFSDEIQQEGLSMCIMQIDRVFSLLEPVVPDRYVM